MRRTTMCERNEIIKQLLDRVRDGLDGLTTIGDEDAEDRYNEAVFDAVRVLDEMAHQFEAAPDDFIEELAIEDEA